MKRPPEARIEGVIRCRDCRKEALTEYVCAYQKDNTILETSAVRCVCGYSYKSECRYGYLKGDE